MSKTVIIQCAALKDGGHLRASDGSQVMFVSRPELGARQLTIRWARPDDRADHGGTWREVLAAYNERFRETGANPDKLRPAWQLYAHPAYRELARIVGIDNLHILSAGWGLVRAEYLLPNYDITFSSQAPAISVRRKNDAFRDAVQLLDNTSGPLYFFGGLSYLPLYCKLTANVRVERIIYYNSSKIPSAPGCRLIRYQTSTRTNWHYELVHALATAALPG